MSQERVLIVDDDAELRELLCDALEMRGFLCVGAGTVGEALKQLLSFQPQVVLLDLGLPDANGVMFFDGARSCLPEGVPVPPVIVLSGYGDKAHTIDSLEHGAVSFIKKPYDLNYLVGMINTFVGEPNIDISTSA